jgi:glyoxylase-like metal-dependent hydrolase (beta-lactamase superfamily II)
MRVTRITDRLTRLERARFVNAYLVAEEDGYTLVDTTLPRTTQAILAAAREGGRPIVRIVLTHGHADHSGSLDALRAALGEEVPVALGEADARILAGEKVVEGKLRGSWPTVATVPDQLLSGGERIGSLEVVACPGHSPGHVAFLDTRDRTLIAGDAFTTIGRVEVPNRVRQRFPLAALGTQDRRQVLAAARTLRALEPGLLAAGHGKPVRSPLEAIDGALARAAQAAAS